MDAYDVFVIRFESNVNRRYLPVPGLQRIFGIDQKTAEDIAQNLPFLVKRCVTLEMAAQYADALHEIGAEVELRPCQTNLNLSQSTPPAARTSVPSSPVVESPSDATETVSARRRSDRSITETWDSQIPPQPFLPIDTPLRPQVISSVPPHPSGATEPKTSGSEADQGARQPVVDTAAQSANGTHDDRLSHGSLQPSADRDASSPQSNRPPATKQDEQKATFARGIASPTAATLSQSAQNVTPNAARPAFDTRFSPHPFSAARSTDYVSQTSSPADFAPSGFPTTPASIEEPIPEDALKKSFWAPGTGYILSGSILILVGLAFDGSIFTGNTAITDYVFDSLGVCWIVWGLFKLLKKRRGT